MGGFLPVVVGVKAANGERLDKPDVNGDHGPIMLKLGGGITGVPATPGAGGITEVVLGSTASIAFADHDEFREADHSTLIDGEVIVFQNPPGSYVWFETDGAGLHDDDETILKPNDIDVSLPGRAYPSSPSAVVATWAALGLAKSGQQSAIHMQAYSSIGDGGGGIFDDDPSDETSTDDGGTIRVAGNRRLKRRYSGALSVEWFGVKHDGVRIDPSAPVDSETVSVTGGVASVTRSVGTFEESDVGKLIRINTPSMPATGTVTVTNAATNITGTVSITEGSETITGSGTAFTTELRIGRKIYIQGAKRRIIDITSDTSMRVYPAPEYSASFTAANLSDTFTAVGHTLTNGQRVKVTNIGGALPTGINETRKYYVVNVSGNTFQLSRTSGGAAINITDDGTGVQYFHRSGPTTGSLNVSYDGKLVGAGTAFTTELYRGQPIVIGTTMYEVVHILSNTLVVLNKNAGASASGLTLYRCPQFVTTIQGATGTSTATLTDAPPVTRSGVGAVFGTDDSAAWNAAEVVAGEVGAALESKPGIVMLGSTINRVSATTWRMPRGAFIEGPGSSATSGDYSGLQFEWAGAYAGTMISAFNTQRCLLDGAYLNGGLVAKYGLLVDSENDPESLDHSFLGTFIEYCWVGAKLGTSGIVARASDGIRFEEDFVFRYCTRACIEIDSGNSAQDSKFERGRFLMYHQNSYCAGLLLTFAPQNFQVSLNAFGADVGYCGAAIDLAYPATSGGSPLIVKGNDFELAMDIGCAIATHAADGAGGVIQLSANIFNSANIYIAHRRQVIFDGNYYVYDQVDPVWGAGRAMISDSTSRISVNLDQANIPLVAGVHITPSANNGAAITRVGDLQGASFSVEGYNAAAFTRGYRSRNDGADSVYEYEFRHGGAGNDFPDAFELWNHTDNIRVWLGLPSGRFRVPLGIDMVGTDALPTDTAAGQAIAALRLDPGGGIALVGGVYSAGTHVWLQGQHTSLDGPQYPVWLSPKDGGVKIGSLGSRLTTKFRVTGTISFPSSIANGSYDTATFSATGVLATDIVSGGFTEPPVAGLIWCIRAKADGIEVRMQNSSGGGVTPGTLGVSFSVERYL